jgi:hypothetical protein
MLIELSYEVSRQENRICTPETPLSEMGRILYMSFWKRQILQVFYDEMIQARQKKRRSQLNVENVKQIS